MFTPPVRRRIRILLTVLGVLMSWPILIGFIQLLHEIFA